MVCVAAGAFCPDGATFTPKVTGSEWVASDGIFKLVSCPKGTELLNSTMGTSYGTFAAAFQQCKPCGEGKYIIDPNRDECQDCPPG